MAKKDEDLSIEDSLKQAMAQVEEENTPEKVEKKEAAPKEEVAEEETEEPESDTKEPESDTEEAQPEKKEDEVETPKEEEEADDWEPPRCLNEEERGEFKTLPKDLKPFADRFIRRRELANQRWVTKVKQEAQGYVQQATAPYGEIEQLIVPHAQRLQLDGQGRTIATAIDTALQWDKFIEESPTEALAELCRRKQVSPREIFDYMSGGVTQAGEDPTGVVRPQGSPDPRVGQMFERLNRLEQENQQLQTGAVRSSWKGVVDQLASQRDAGGESLYPYYEDIRPEMAQWTRLIGEQEPNLAPAELFHKAYEKACWSNETVRGILLNDRQVKRTTTALSKKRAGSSLPASSGNGIGSIGKETPLSDNLTIEESLRAAAAQHGLDL